MNKKEWEQKVLDCLPEFPRGGISILGIAFTLKNREIREPTSEEIEEWLDVKDKYFEKMGYSFRYTRWEARQYIRKARLEELKRQVTNAVHRLVKRNEILKETVKRPSRLIVQKSNLYYETTPQLRGVGFSWFGKVTYYRKPKKQTGESK